MTAHRTLPWNPYAARLYRFYESTSTQTDGAGMNNLAVHGGCTFGTTDGIPCATFDGSTAFMSAGTSTVRSGFTIEALFKVTAFPTFGHAMVVYSGNTASNGWGIGLHYTAGGTKFAVLLGGVTSIDLADITPSLNTWYHMAMTRDNTTIRVYINGVKSSTTSTAVPNVPSGEFRVGAAYSGNSWFSGKVAGVRLVESISFPDEYITATWDDVSAAPHATPTDGCVLRCYKTWDGSGSYTDVSNATAGGFERFVRTEVLNDCGSLQVDLVGTTPKAFNAIIQECARVEFFNDGALVQSYQVDDYTARYTQLSCSVNLAGPLINTSNPIALTFATEVEAYVAIQTAINAINASKGAEVVRLNLDKADALTGGQPLSARTVEMTGLDFLKALAKLFSWAMRVDEVGDLVLTPMDIAPTATADVTYTIGTSTSDARDFDSTYPGRGIINALALTYPDGSTGTRYVDSDSITLYGIHAGEIPFPLTPESVDDDGRWCQAMLAISAYPQGEYGLSVNHDPTRHPGLLAQVTGLDDGRTYKKHIQQITWDHSDINHDELRLGAPPLALA